jgi:hypothetical protein
MRQRVADWAQMRMLEPNISTADAARRLGISPKTLYAYISRANREGWLRFDSPMDRIEYEVIPKAVDNLKYWLDLKDKTATLETMKGTAFPAYREQLGIQEAPTTVLAIKIEPTPHRDGQEMVITNNRILGRSKFSDTP